MGTEGKKNSKPVFRFGNWALEPKGYGPPHPHSSSARLYRPRRADKSPTQWLRAKALAAQWCLGTRAPKAAS